MSLLKCDFGIRITASCGTDLGTGLVETRRLEKGKVAVRARELGLAAGAVTMTAMAQAGQDIPRIELICAADAQSECVALHDALKNQAPKAHITTLYDPTPDTDGTALRVYLQIVRRAPDFIIAQLAWNGDTAHPENLITGPQVEVSVSDATLTPKTLSQLAEGLLNVTPLPI